jgi:two-component system, NtrC family, response regulator AtoC
MQRIMDLPLSPGPFLGRSKAVLQLLELIERAAQVDVPVLLTGETGTGKSHLARLLHSRSPRGEGPLVSVNCAGFPDGLFESELFGHCRGAFTGAVESREGLFEQAGGGVLFLDEVGELPLSQQAKLLTVLEEKRVRPVGGTRTRPVDARIVSATSRDIKAEVAAGAFRADLYHRIALIRCEIPPLRARPDDLALLTSWLLAELARKYRKPSLALTADALALVVEHSWPGNVRELAHVLEASAILSKTREIGAEQLGPMLAGATTTARSPTAEPSADDPSQRSPRYSFFGSENQEREAILSALIRCRGNRTRAARELGMARNTLGEKVRKYQLES